MATRSIWTDTLIAGTIASLVGLVGTIATVTASDRATHTQREIAQMQLESQRGIERDRMELDHRRNVCATAVAFLGDENTNPALSRATRRSIADTMSDKLSLCVLTKEEEDLLAERRRTYVPHTPKIGSAADRDSANSLKPSPLGINQPPRVRK